MRGETLNIPICAVNVEGQYGTVHSGTVTVLVQSRYQIRGTVTARVIIYARPLFN